MTTCATVPTAPGGADPATGAAEPAEPARALLLDAWAARSCPVKTQHRFGTEGAPRGR